MCSVSSIALTINTHVARLTHAAVAHPVIGLPPMRCLRTTWKDRPSTPSGSIRTRAAEKPRSCQYRLVLRAVLAQMIHDGPRKRRNPPRQRPGGLLQVTIQPSIRTLHVVISIVKHSICGLWIGNRNGRRGSRDRPPGCPGPGCNEPIDHPSPAAPPIRGCWTGALPRATRSCRPGC